MSAMNSQKGKRKGEGVQVVSVCSAGAYSVCGAALRAVLCRAELRALPVAVLSVAGATRGGKSFLLDFFLRYLTATAAAQRDGTWIGADDEALDGFSWRGGWQPNTTGILLWSEPIVVTQLVNGTTRKIVVLLMDTQGTFDNSSTVRDCTTIFALSTLISSVQIYNLAQQIKEDDLQHLQLFTQYGKLAVSETEAKPFQALIFRVRDWMCPFEHPYGATGGENYLESILKIDRSKNEELRELREQIRGSFDSISCFLMPHPGFAVTDENFSGRLSDLRPEFIDSLLGFVPSVLDSSKLIPKVINGQEIAVGDLLNYFNSYIELFNSEEIPTPVTILKATSSACLEGAISAARDVYVTQMDNKSKECSVPRSVIPRLHAAAKEGARQAFLARRTLAAPERAAQRLDRLLQELDDLLPTYIGLNVAKTQKLISESMAAYEAALRQVSGTRPLCLHPRDVAVLHDAACAAAAVTFDTARCAPTPPDLDDDRIALMKTLEAKLSETTALSELSNAAVTSRACAQYSGCMQRCVRGGGGAVSATRLQAEHERAATAATRELAGARSRHTDHPDSEDHFLNEILKYIQDQFDYLESVNKGSSKSAKQAAVFSYNNHMAGVWGPMACLHPNTLREEHQSAVRRAIDEFRALADDPEQENDIVAILEQRYEDLRRQNITSNEALVAESYMVYTHQMDSKCTPSLASILVIPWLVKVLVMIPKFHQQYRSEALDHFRSKRRGSADDDEFIESLKSKLDDGFESYSHPLQALAREFGIPLPT